MEHPKETIENLVLSGGGVCGLAHAGALLALEQANLLQHVKRIEGTSAGSIVGLLYVLGYSAEEIYHIALETDFSKLLDGNPLKNAFEFFHDYGYYSGDKLVEFFQSHIEKKFGDPNVTFADLHKHTQREFYVVTANLSSQTICILSHESTLYRNTPLALAVRASISLPGIFTPVQFPGITSSPDMHIDGGVFDNFRLSGFDSARYVEQEPSDPNKTVFNPHTLGLRVESEFYYQTFESKKIQHISIKNFWEYWSTLLSALLNNQVQTHRSEADKNRSIISDTGTISGTDFKLPMQQRQQLLLIGYQAAQNFINTTQKQPISYYPPVQKLLSQFQLVEESSLQVFSLSSDTSPSSSPTTPRATR